MFEFQIEKVGGDTVENEPQTQDPTGDTHTKWSHGPTLYCKDRFCFFLFSFFSFLSFFCAKSWKVNSENTKHGQMLGRDPYFARNTTS